MAGSCFRGPFGAGLATRTGHGAPSISFSAVDPTTQCLRCGRRWDPTTTMSAPISVASWSSSRTGLPARRWMPTVIPPSPPMAAAFSLT